MIVLHVALILNLNLEVVVDYLDMHSDRSHIRLDVRKIKNTQKVRKNTWICTVTDHTSGLMYAKSIMTFVYTAEKL